MNTTSMTLQAGEQLALHLPRGTRLHVLAGRLRAQPPALWLGDTLVWHHEDWHEGHAAVIDTAGSWQWSATVAATLLLCRPAPFWRRCLDALRGNGRQGAQATGPRAFPCVSSPNPSDHCRLAQRTPAGASARVYEAASFGQPIGKRPRNG